MWQELFEVLCQDSHLFLPIRVAEIASPHFTGETKDTGALNNWAKGYTEVAGSRYTPRGPSL